jgi:hypothetical protein
MIVSSCSTGYRLRDGTLRTVYREAESPFLPKGFKVWKVTTPKGVFLAITMAAVERLMKDTPSQWEVYRQGATLTYGKNSCREA